MAHPALRSPHPRGDVSVQDLPVPQIPSQEGIKGWVLPEEANQRARFLPGESQEMAHPALQAPIQEGIKRWVPLGHTTAKHQLHPPMAHRIIPYNPILKERARRLRKNMTPGEVKLWQRLKRKQLLGYDFDRQRPIDQFIVDFYCKQLMLAIEIDGSSHDSEAAQAKDRKRQARLEALGVRFLRFREAEVHRDIEAVVEAITAWVLAHPPK